MSKEVTRLPIGMRRRLVAGGMTIFCVWRAGGENNGNGIERSRILSAVLLRHLLGITLALLSLSVVVPSSRAQTCTANIPHIDGEWQTLPYLMPINPISATLLNTGKVLIVAGSENDAKNNSPGAESYRNATWDPTGATQSSITVQNMEYDVFCS